MGLHNGDIRKLFCAVKTARTTEDYFMSTSLTVTSGGLAREPSIGNDRTPMKQLISHSMWYTKVTRFLASDHCKDSTYWLQFEENNTCWLVIRYIISQVIGMGSDGLLRCTLDASAQI